jgi:peptide chain release factor 1
MIDIEGIKKEYESLVNQLSDPELISDWEKFEGINKRKGHLERLLEKVKNLQDLRKEVEGNKSILNSGEDETLMTLAQEEINRLLIKEKELEKEIQNMVKEKRETGSVILEIRAGTGGEEAALFARDLYRMYAKYAHYQSWQEKILDSRVSDLGGFKEIIFEISDSDVFSKLKYEGGVHRVQRIPATEKSGRIHTSTATVAVLLKPKKTQLRIKPEDLRIDFYRASGPGGQYVNRRETAVRITHFPTGLVVTSQNERNQLQNKENAMKILEARILEMNERKEAQKIHGKRKTQIGWAKRAEKIRTYNFPQDRLTDHRVKKSWKNLEKILNGQLQPIIEFFGSMENYLRD